jgi:hypothetical protein
MSDSSSLIRVSTLVEAVNIPNFNPWGCRRKITFKEINEFIRGNELRREASTANTTEQHIARIAYLVVNGWNDPIDIDVGVPSLSCHISHIVTDGNHRLWAAAVRGDEFIAAEISGCVDTIKEVLGVDI